MNITPYNYFPMKKPSTELSTSNYCDLLEETLPPSRVRENWCKCKHCPRMPTIKESVCCRDVISSECQYSKNWVKIVGLDCTCFSLHPKIQKLITDVEELDLFISFDQYRLKQVARYSRGIYVDEYASADSMTKYRFACYRKLTFLVHETLGIGNRVQIPACVVAAIRSQYPSSTKDYVGYQECFHDDNID